MEQEFYYGFLDCDDHQDLKGVLTPNMSVCAGVLLRPFHATYKQEMLKGEVKQLQKNTVLEAIRQLGEANKSFVFYFDLGSHFFPWHSISAF